MVFLFVYCGLQRFSKRHMFRILAQKSTQYLYCMSRYIPEPRKIGLSQFTEKLYFRFQKYFFIRLKGDPRQQTQNSILQP